ncbi:hypothetical protein V8F20_011857 [Naviculisporaceae sp. PSN 640]
MDYQNRVGSKFGGGGPASHSATNADRRERLRKLALETIDLEKDPYIFKNHLGSFECRLCLTVHQNDGSYLAHTQGKKHQTNLARRAAREQKENGGPGKGDIDPQTGLPYGVVGAGFAALGLGGGVARKTFIKTGRPAYQISKVCDRLTQQKGMIFHVWYPDIERDVEPKWQIMSAFAQQIETPDRNYQYLLIAAEPYETVGFKIPSLPIDKREERHFSFWDPDAKEYWLQIMFQTERDSRFNSAPGLAPAPTTSTTTTANNNGLPAFPGPFRPTGANAINTHMNKR